MPLPALITLLEGADIEDPLPLVNVDLQGSQSNLLQLAGDVCVCVGG